MTKATTPPTTPTPTAAPTAPEAPVAMRWAWGVCWLMFFSTVLNYMDRQAIALVNPQIRREFGISHEGFGWVLTAFYLSYALFQVPAGFVVDRFNIWRVYAGAVAFWSLAGMAIAFAPALGLLIVMRALLGVGESFNWPCALRVTGVILPPRDRTLGNGIFNSGAAIGAVLTPLSVPPLAALFGWRVAFVMIGLLGFVWVGAWWVATRPWRLAGVGDAQPEPPANAADPGAEAGPRGLTRRGRLAFGSVLALALATMAAGYLWTAPVPVTLARLEPLAAVSLVEWKVKPGDKVERDKTVLAEFRVGDAAAAFVSPDEGRVVRFLAAPGDAVEPGRAVLELDDTARRFEVPMTTLRAEADGRLVRRAVEPSEAVRRGDPLAEVELGGVPSRVRAAHDGQLARFEVAEGSAAEPKGTLAVLHVHGFDQAAYGLPGVWWGIAVLMFGSLLAARLVAPDDLRGSGWARRLGEIVRMRGFWVLVVVSGSVNVTWHFLVNLIPSFLQTDRRMTYLAGGMLSALPFVAADLGNLGGGAASRRLASRGLTPARARLLVMAVCCVLIGTGAAIGSIPAGPGWNPLVLVVLGAMALGAAAFMANYFAYAQEVSASHTGLIVGYLGGLGNLLASGFFPVAGRIKDATGSFGPVFLLIALLPFVGLAMLALAWDARRPEPVPPSDSP